jgi:hypothetical protein
MAPNGLIHGSNINVRYVTGTVIAQLCDYAAMYRIFARSIHSTKLRVA